LTMVREMKRHDARILALSALFCWDLSRGEPDEVFQEVQGGYFSESPRFGYAKEIFLASVKNAAEIDGMIARASQGWPIARMPRVDLSILRLAVAEAHYVNKTPYEVVIDEALELSKEFSTHASPRFVNGVLVAIFREIGYTKKPTE